jgi:hypothetical protein
VSNSGNTDANRVSRNSFYNFNHRDRHGTENL